MYTSEHKSSNLCCQVMLFVNVYLHIELLDAEVT